MSFPNTGIMFIYSVIYQLVSYFSYEFIYCTEHAKLIDFFYVKISLGKNEETLFLCCTSYQTMNSKLSVVMPHVSSRLLQPFSVGNHVKLNNYSIVWPPGGSRASLGHRYDLNSPRGIKLPSTGDAVNSINLKIRLW